MDNLCACVIKSVWYVCVWADLSKEKTSLNLTFSSCHGAKSPWALKPERNAAMKLTAQPSLSLSLSIVSALYLSPTVYLSVLLQKWLLCFALSHPSLYNLSALCNSNPLPSFFLLCHSKAAPPLPPSLPRVWRQDKTCRLCVTLQRQMSFCFFFMIVRWDTVDVHNNFATKLPFSLLREYSHCSVRRVYFEATSTTVKLSWRLV